jgi:hypothetical protein
MDERKPSERIDLETEERREARVAGVLARTSGPVCGRAHALLASAAGAPDAPEAELPAIDRELLDLHLATCGECRALAAVLAALARDLPRLAAVRPEPGFAAGVLAATLPPAVRWRRSWRRLRAESWPRWVRRPRFAWEAAFVLTLVALPIFAAPEAPLEAMPERALALARENPLARLEGPASAVEERLGAALPAVQASAPVREAERRVAASRAAFGEWAELAGLAGLAGLAELPRQAERLFEEGSAGLGTLFETVASLLESSDETPSANPQHPTEETIP